MEIPHYVTHYYRSVRPPFLNLSDLPDESIDEIIGQLADEHSGGGSFRVFGRRYMELRRLTEDRLRRHFVEGGGRPFRQPLRTGSPRRFAIAAECYDLIFPRG